MVRTRNLCFLAAFAVLAIAGVFLLLSNRIPPRAGDPTEPVESSSRAEPFPEKVEREIITLPEAEEVIAGLHSGDDDPLGDLERLGHLLYLYRQLVGANPEGGENMLIVESLNGANEKGLRFLPGGNPFVNEQGELVDRWGTPYFFHPVSRDEMEIVSAGPDAELWTEDDVRLP